MARILTAVITIMQLVGFHYRNYVVVISFSFDVFFFNFKRKTICFNRKNIQSNK